VVTRVHVAVFGLWVGQVVTVIALVAAPALGGFLLGYALPAGLWVLRPWLAPVAAR
jgi:hypothetical protein